ncbi:MAG: PqqD family protein [Nitrospirota bacterium]
MKVEEKKHFPPKAILSRLALNESGFVFDPVTGKSFTINETGMALLGLMRQKDNLKDILKAVVADYQVDAREAERDILEFSAHIWKIVR